MTISEALYQRLKSKADAQNISIPRLIESLLEASEKAKAKKPSTKEKPENVYGTLESYL